MACLFFRRPIQNGWLSRCSKQYVEDLRMRNGYLRDALTAAGRRQMIWDGFSKDWGVPPKHDTGYMGTIYGWQNRYIYIYRLGNIYWYYMVISWYGSYLGFYHPKTNMVQTYHYPFLFLDEDAFTVPAVWVSHPWIIHMVMLNAKMSFVTTGWNGFYKRNIQYKCAPFQTTPNDWPDYNYILYLTEFWRDGWK